MKWLIYCFLSLQNVKYCTLKSPLLFCLGVLGENRRKAAACLLCSSLLPLLEEWGALRRSLVLSLFPEVPTANSEGSWYLGAVILFFWVSRMLHGNIMLKRHPRLPFYIQGACCGCPHWLTLNTWGRGSATLNSCFMNSSWKKWCSYGA